MQKQAIELLNFRIMVDPEFNMIDRRQRHDWQTKLSVLRVAKLIINSLGECTLAENFSNTCVHSYNVVELVRILNMWKLIICVIQYYFVKTCQRACA